LSHLLIQSGCENDDQLYLACVLQIGIDGLISKEPVFKWAPIIHFNFGPGNFERLPLARVWTSRSFCLRSSAEGSIDQSLKLVNDDEEQKQTDGGSSVPSAPRKLEFYKHLSWKSLEL
jgi:hypothetical protein